METIEVKTPAPALPETCGVCGADAAVTLAGSHYCERCYYEQGSCCSVSCDADAE